MESYSWLQNLDTGFYPEPVHVPTTYILKSNSMAQGYPSKMTQLAKIFVAFMESGVS
jgi:hypothetical protein